jgi:hypothetical protein
MIKPFREGAMRTDRGLVDPYGRYKCGDKKYMCSAKDRMVCISFTPTLPQVRTVLYCAGHLTVPEFFFSDWVKDLVLESQLKSLSLQQDLLSLQCQLWRHPYGKIFTELCHILSLSSLSYLLCFLHSGCINNRYVFSQFWRLRRPR